MQGNIRGHMHGVPIAVKDQMWTKGIRSTGGSRILADFVPDEDATVIAKLKEAGAVLLGKTNLSEFAITPFSHRFSLPRNPWDLDLSAGGSSSGSGAATAAFLCATSLGEDTGRLHPPAGRVVRLGGYAANLGSGQPLRGYEGHLVHGHRRPHFPQRSRRGHHSGRHSRPRPQGPLQLEQARPGLLGRFGRGHQRHPHRRGHRVASRRGGGA